MLFLFVSRKAEKRRLLNNILKDPLQNRVLGQFFRVISMVLYYIVTLA